MSSIGGERYRQIIASDVEAGLANRNQLENRDLSAKVLPGVKTTEHSGGDEARKDQADLAAVRETLKSMLVAASKEAATPIAVPSSESEKPPKGLLKKVAWYFKREDAD
jgi:hypothetical protein